MPKKSDFTKILNFWNSKSPILCRHRQGGTATVQLASRLTLEALKINSAESIMAAIDFYSKILVDESLILHKYPHPPWRIGLDEFFEFSTWNKRSINERRILFLKDKSWFEICFPRDLAPILRAFKALPVDEHPEITRMLWDAFNDYFRNIRGGRELQEKVRLMSPLVQAAFEQYSPRMVYAWHRTRAGFIFGCLIPYIQHCGIYKFSKLHVTPEFLSEMEFFLVEGDYFIGGLDFLKGSRAVYAQYLDRFEEVDERDLANVSGTLH